MSGSSTELDALVRGILSDIAPDVDIAGLRAEDDMRDSLDIDSVDFLNFVAALHEQTGVDIPERDYPMVSTISRCVDYLTNAARDLRR
ncbi:MAG TPA: acyl carrier protein [Acidimicrobiales bacterium]|nr:acyl carrier protein [Acidimicrobiales bacterium]